MLSKLLSLFKKVNFLRILESKTEESDIGLSLQTLVLSLLLVVYIISGPLLKKYEIKIIRPSGFIMIIALIITFLSKRFFPNSSFYKGFQFNNTFIVTFILPIVIFSSSYNSKIESFLKYIKHILLFSIPGTIISFFIIEIATSYFNNNGYFESLILIDEDTIKIETIKLSLLEILQFSAAISACDSVVSLSFITEDNEPKLNAISLGDAILNNAVAISLFNSILAVSENEKNFSFSLSLKILIKSILIFICSLIIGIIIGICHSLFLRYMKKFNLDRVQEISTMLLFGFISYILCNCLNLSGIVSILACGLCMSHYMFYNLQYQTREESALISRVLCLLAEALIFSSLGMNIIYYTYHSFSYKFIIIELILIILCRFFTIFGQIYILNLLGLNPMIFKLKNLHKGILTIIGSIRGVITFSLSLLMITPNIKNKNLLIGSTIYIVFFTDIIYILLSAFFKKRQIEIYSKKLLGSGDDKAMKHDIFTFIHPNTEINIPEPKKIRSKESIERKKNSVVTKFINYDNKVILPKIINNWPEIKEDNNNISRRIKKALGLWADEKEKNQIYQFNDTIQFNIPGINYNRANTYIRKENIIQEENNNGPNRRRSQRISKKFELKNIYGN